MFVYLNTSVFLPLKKKKTQQRNRHTDQDTPPLGKQEVIFLPLQSLTCEEVCKPRNLISQLSAHNREDPRSCLSQLCNCRLLQ